MFYPGQIEADVRLTDACIQYLSYMQARKNATHTTIETYRLICVAFTKGIGDIEAEALTVVMVDDYANKLSQTNICPNTLRNKLTIIRGFVRWMYARDIVNFKPELIELPKANAVEANFLTIDEANKLLSVIDNHRDRAMIHFLLATGMRVDEMLATRLQDLHERSVVVRCGKGRKPRVTFITPNCLEEIKRYLRKRGKHEGYLFENPNGDKMSRVIPARKVKHYAAKAGIEKTVTPHTLRHTFATTILRKGARVEDVQQILGHANIRTTSIYLHFTNEYLSDRYDQFMGS